MQKYSSKCTKSLLCQLVLLRRKSHLHHGQLDLLRYILHLLAQVDALTLILSWFRTSDWYLRYT
jgi:hypothetical protein